MAQQPHRRLAALAGGIQQAGRQALAPLRWGDEQARQPVAFIQLAQAQRREQLALLRHPHDIISLRTHGRAVAAIELVGQRAKKRRKRA